MGHLFQGRFKAILVDAESYLLELIRYIHLNPVRAGLSKMAEEYPWSGHKAYLGIDQIPWLTTDAVMIQFSKRTSEARRNYRDFVCEGIGEEHRSEFHHGVRGIKNGDLLGDDHFIEEVLENCGETYHQTVNVAEVVDVVCDSQTTKSDLTTSGKGRLASDARAAAAFIVRELPDLYLMELSRHINRDVTSLSSSIKRLLIRSEKDIQLKSRFDELTKKYHA